MIAILDWQHHGKPGRNDRGASFDVNGDGELEYETELTRGYIDAAAHVLESAGHHVYIFDDGTYRSRHARANTIARAIAEPVAYLACHLNAGGGDYGMVLYDWRSGGGAQLASELVKALSPRLAEVGRSRTMLSSPDQWGRAWSTIRGIYDGPAHISGACLEPAFMDTSKHHPLFTSEGLKRIGEAIAVGLMSWDLERRTAL